jgi:hypothetical protein
MRVGTLGLGAALVVAASSLGLNGALSARAAMVQTSSAAAAIPPPAELDRLLAPIALYPDQLLAQMFLCAINPSRVSALDEWMAANPKLKSTPQQEVVSGCSWRRDPTRRAARGTTWSEVR